MKVLSYPQLKPEKGIPYSRQWIRKLVIAGCFPAPIDIGPARKGFVESKVDAWLEKAKHARDTAHGKATSA